MVVPMLATPAGAAIGCDSGQFPASFAAQSALKVDCNTDTTVSVNHIEIHDADNVTWHHGAARSVVMTPGGALKATTSASTTIKFAAGKIGPADIRRPISGVTAGLEIFKGGAFISTVLPAACTTACTSATVSQAVNTGAAYTLATATVKIEHTASRVITDAVCGALSTGLTSTSAKFVGNDVNKSVSGEGWPSGTFISAIVSGTSVTLNQASIGACTAGHLATIGAETNNGGSPEAFNGDASTEQLSRTATGGQGFTCTAAAKNLVLSAGAMSDSGGFNRGDIGLALKWTTGSFTGAAPVSIANVGPAATATTVASFTGTAAVAGTLTITTAGVTTSFPLTNGHLHVATSDNVGADFAYTTNTTGTKTFSGLTLISGTGNIAAAKAVNTGDPSNTAVLNANCPTTVSTTVGAVAVGIAGANAAATNAPVMTLAAELNLNPTLVKTQDDCANNTIEGFEVIGGIVQPGGFTASASTPQVSVGQIIFPTSVVSFNGWIVPKAGGETLGAYTDANAHFNFSFAILPTSSAVCLSAGLPTNNTELAFGISSTTYTVAPFLPTGSGNPADPPVRSLLGETGSFSQTMQLITNPATIQSTSVGTACVIAAATAPPGLTCGDG